MHSNKKSWKSAILTLLLAVSFFLFFKKILPENIFPETTALDKEHQAVDEWMESAMETEEEEDSVKIEIEKEEKLIEEKIKDTTEKPVEKSTPEEPKIVDARTEDLEKETYLEFFYKQLALLEENPDDEKVRIAYFGDSMTDGDLIVQDIRRKFQEKYGGRGVGFVPITSESANSRASIIHRFSNNWKTYSFMKKHDKDFPFGLTGMVFYAEDSLGYPSVSYKSGVNAGDNLLPNPVLYYGNSTNDSAEVKMITLKDTTSFELKSAEKLNKLALKSGVLNNFELHFEKADSIPFYGVNFDIPTGVQVDNFSKRGNSGLPITQLKRDLMHAFQNELNYDLIVLHFGTNVLNSDSFNYAWYSSRMKNVVSYVRKLFPKSSVLVISIADKAKKYDTRMQTDSAVNYLLAAQKSYAAEEKAGFINLYALMGGEGSMVKWVEEEPQKANKDYTHFNPNGAREIAELIYKNIDKGFEEYKVKQKEIKKQQEKKERKKDSLRQEELKIQHEKELQKDTADVSTS